MKSFDLINRRTHLYLSFFLFPWLFMYGFSSLLISHHSWVRSGQEPVWSELFNKPYDISVPQDQDVREIGQKILSDNDFHDAFWADRPNPNRININQFSFWTSNRLTYFVNEKRLLAEHQAFGWDQVVLRLHFRGGFQQSSLLDTLWGLIVDLVCLSIMVWITTGLIMWWKIRKTRLWGVIAIAGGFLSCILLIWGM